MPSSKSASRAGTDTPGTIDDVQAAATNAVMDYGFGKTLDGVDYDDAIARIRAALAEEGFGVLTEIDVKATLKKKIDVDFGRYVILGACNPKLAHRALQFDPKIGLLLPCNVVVREIEGGSEIQVIDPKAMFTFIDAPGIGELAKEAEDRLRRALAAV
jgi:uncharacterized protein (DUF302 family)